MTPTSILNDLIYVERYHRDHGAPLTADIMVRARHCINRFQMALGRAEIPQGDAIMVFLVSEIEAQHNAMLQAHRALLKVYDSPDDPGTRSEVFEALQVVREVIYPPAPEKRIIDPSKDHADNSSQSVA